MSEQKKIYAPSTHGSQKRKHDEQPTHYGQNKKLKSGPSAGGHSSYQHENISGKDNFEFFFGSKSPFSQHYSTSYTVNGVTFNCAEQYMMYQKAVIFKDKEFENKIMATSNPVQQKKYGRKVRNFDPKVWGSQCIDVVERANMAKFSQNPKLKAALLGTYPRLLVEASPRDRLWGIGLGRNNPKAWDKKTWRGRNQLGTILTRVRDRLKKEEEGEMTVPGDKTNTVDKKKGPSLKEEETVAERKVDRSKEHGAMRGEKSDKEKTESKTNKGVGERKDTGDKNKRNVEKRKINVDITKYLTKNNLDSKK